ncbi:hypothetical protein ACA910_006936 [Epithemia clementina (nom. ined.)]
MQEKLSALKCTQLKRQFEREKILLDHPEMRIEIERLKHHNKNMLLAELVDSPQTPFGQINTREHQQQKLQHYKCHHEAPSVETNIRAYDLKEREDGLLGFIQQQSLTSASGSTSSHLSGAEKSVMLYALLLRQQVGLNQFSSAQALVPEFRTDAPSFAASPRQQATPTFGGNSFTVPTSTPPTPRFVVSPPSEAAETISWKSSNAPTMPSQYGRTVDLTGLAGIIKNGQLAPLSLAASIQQERLRRLLLAPQQMPLHDHGLQPYVQDLHAGFSLHLQHNHKVNFPSPLSSLAQDRHGNRGGFVRNVSLSSETTFEGAASTGYGGAFGDPQAMEALNAAGIPYHERPVVPVEVLRQQDVQTSRHVGNPPPGYTLQDDWSSGRTFPPPGTTQAVREVSRTDYGVSDSSSGPQDGSDLPSSFPLSRPPPVFQNAQNQHQQNNKGTAEEHCVDNVGEQLAVQQDRFAVAASAETRGRSPPSLVAQEVNAAWDTQQESPTMRTCADLQGLEAPQAPVKASTPQEEDGLEATVRQDPPRQMHDLQTPENSDKPSSCFSSRDYADNSPERVSSSSTGTGDSDSLSDSVAEDGVDDQQIQPERRNMPDKKRKRISECSKPKEAKKKKKIVRSSGGVRKDPQWLQMYEKLKDYRGENGDCLVPRGYPPSPSLASWVAEQRKQFKRNELGKRSTLTAERIEMLNALDFSWDAQAAAWSNHYSDLMKFKEKFGHCHVPLSHTEFPKLGLWVKEQRRHYNLMKAGRRTHMNVQRSQTLTDIGFCWNTHDASWLSRYYELSDYRKRFGDCNVPQDWPEDPAFGAWVSHQRRQCTKGLKGNKRGITCERIKLLTELGFQWQTNNSMDYAAKANSSNKCLEQTRRLPVLTKRVQNTKEKNEDNVIEFDGNNDEDDLSSSQKATKLACRHDDKNHDDKKKQGSSSHAKKAGELDCNDNDDDDDDRTLSDYSAANDDDDDDDDDDDYSQE